MIRIFAFILTLTAHTLAQLPFIPVTNFTHPIFAGNGTIGVTSDSFTGDIWVVDFSNAVNLHRFDLAGTLLSSHPTNFCTPAMTSPNDLTQDRNTGNLWLVDNDLGGSVLEYTTAGTCVGGFSLGGAFLNPVSMAHHTPTSTLYIGHQGAVAHYNTTGTNLGTGFPLSLGSVSAIISSLTYNPLTNNFLAAASSQNIIYEVSFTGSIIGQTSMGQYGITNIQGIDYDPFNARFLVADNSNVTIYVFADPSGGPQFQVNPLEASLDVNGITGNSVVPGLVNLMVNQVAALNLMSTLVPSPWELGIGTAPPISVSQGALVLNDGQILNLDFSDPTLLLTWGGFQSPPFLNTTIPFSVPFPITLTAQMVIVDTFSLSGVRLSAPIHVVIQ